MAVSLLCSPGSSDAQSNFYANKTISLVVGASVGGGYDVYARAFAPFLSAHIPGKPTVIVKNLPGAGGLASVLHLDASAPKDGTVITTFNAGVLTNAFANPEQAKVDLRGLAWLGSLNRSFRFCYFWRGRGFATWADLNGGREATLGSIGTNSAAYNDIALLRHLLKAKVRAVSGYPGRSEVHLAIERGELDGDCGSWTSMPEEWLRDSKITIHIRFSRTLVPGMPPSAAAARDLLTDPKKRDIFNLLTASAVVGRPYIAPKGVPADRLAALRAAFDATMKDPEFLADSEKQHLAVTPMTGAEVETFVKELYRTPPDIAAAAREISGE